MNSLTTPPAAIERPRGVEFLAALAFLTALASVLIAALNFAGSVPLATGAWLLAGGLEVLGPWAFLLYGLITAAAGFGLLRLQNWARHLAIVILLAGIVLVTSSISTAVADGRILALAREGLQIIVRTASLWYLFQGPVRDAFQKPAS